MVRVASQRRRVTRSFRMNRLATTTPQYDSAMTGNAMLSGTDALSRTLGGPPAEVVVTAEHDRAARRGKPVRHTADEGSRPGMAPAVRRPDLTDPRGLRGGTSCRSGKSKSLSRNGSLFHSSWAADLMRHALSQLSARTAGQPGRPRRMPRPADRTWWRTDRRWPSASHGHRAPRSGRRPARKSGRRTGRWPAGG